MYKVLEVCYTAPTGILPIIATYSVELYSDDLDITFAAHCESFSDRFGPTLKEH